MINIQLTELDLSLEVAEITDLGAVLDEVSSVGLQGPLIFGLDTEPLNYGYLDLNLIGFPHYGLSAYELALQDGFIGSLSEWLASLEGAPGTLAPVGLAAVANAQAAAASASGDATAAAGFRNEAFTYSGFAGVHAQSASEMATQAIAARNETDGIAAAMTVIRQTSEALLTDTQQVATATIQQRVLAETARAAAELAETQAAQSKTNAEYSASEASNQATLAVNARNLANASAAAAVLSASNASSYANDAQTDANASRTSQIIASAARDTTNVIAAAVVISEANAAAHASAAGQSATASESSSVSANASYQAAQNIADYLASINPTLNYLGEFDHEPTQVELGAAWKQNAFYKNSLNGYSYVLTGAPLEWERYLADGTLYQLTVESNNGTVFRVGQMTYTTLKGRLFKNGAEITDVTPSSYFSWRRVSADATADAIWNALYTAGYKQVTISVDDVNSRASFFCDITSPT